jgi:POT family proton-dependent oligopeptide transporter
VREILSRDGLLTLGRLLALYLFVAVFWALYDQTGSAWVLQAQSMDRVMLGVEILPAQIQAANPLLVMLLVPAFSYFIYPAWQRRWRLTALRKIGVGMFLAALAFGISSWAQYHIDIGQTPTIAWQLLAYLVLISGEVMVSITCLEFSYTQAPNTMKSFVMAFFMLSIALGNLFTSLVNFAIEGSELLQGADYYGFFALLMLLTAGLFILFSRFIPVYNRLQPETRIASTDKGGG